MKAYDVVLGLFVLSPHLLVAAALLLAIFDPTEAITLDLWNANAIRQLPVPAYVALFALWLPTSAGVVRRWRTEAPNGLLQWGPWPPLLLLTALFISLPTLPVLAWLWSAGVAGLALGLIPDPDRRMPTLPESAP